ncbi:MAG: sensor histidine kinase [Actinomycetota bacterium]
MRTTRTTTGSGMPPPDGSRDGGRPAPVRVGLAALRAPLSDRARRELAWCLVALAIGAVEVALFGFLVAPDTAVSVTRAIVVAAIGATLLVAAGAARGIGTAFRRLAAGLLGSSIPAPPALAGGTWLARARFRLREGAGWRALGYLALKFPLAALEFYALLYWVGLANVTYPLWWRLFRNHPPGSILRPVPFVTPLGVFQIRTYPGTFLVFAVGVAMLLAAPWVTRGVVAVDRWLLRRVLSPGRLAERVQRLEQARAQVVEDSAVRLRRIERDLHDGAQVQLAALAMTLGQAKEKLEHESGVPYDPAGALELIGTAHRHAKEVMAELRDLARGIHPPSLDLGLDAALATLAARSAVPATLQVDLPGRPAPAIEAIAYFSAAELLANVAKHSRARHAWVEVGVEVAAAGGRLRLAVTDDGGGGARLRPGGGLAGLADRARAVDGSLSLSSPGGGPTVVTVELPLLV